MRAALYARVSSSRQEQERTIESQLDALRTYAAAHGYEVAPQHVFCDDGYSGSQLDRPALDRLRDAAQAHAFDAVLVLSPDRLARRYAYQVLVLEELERLGVHVVFLEQPPLDDPNARLLVQIQGAVAEYERVKIAERNRRGRLFRLRQGEVAMWQVPYGYRRVPRSAAGAAHLEVDEQKAAVVRQIFRWYSEGLTLRAVARRLTELGIPSPGAAPMWWAASVRNILQNSAYIGTWYVNRRQMQPGPNGARMRPPEEWIALTVPAIVDRPTFLRCQQRHTENRRFSPRHLRSARWLLRALVRCARCHHAMVCVQTPSSKGRVNYYYRCRYNTRAVYHRCTAGYVRAPELDALVWQEFVATLLRPAVLVQAIQAGAGVSADSDVLRAQQATLTRQLDAVRRERQRLLDAYQAGALELPELQQRQAALRLREQQWEGELEQLQAASRQKQTERHLVQSLQDLAARLRRRLGELSFEERQRLLRELLEAVEVDLGAVVLHWRIPLPAPPAPGPQVSTESRLRQVGRTLLLLPERPRHRGRHLP